MGTWLLGLTIVGFVVASCSAAGSGASPALSLKGRTFLSVSVTEKGVPRPLVPGTRIQVAFESDRISAAAGCNQMGGSYRLDGGRLVVDGLAMTAMGCDPPRHDQDSWLAAFLTSGPAARMAGDELTLEGGGTIVVLVDRRVADPDRPLVGPTWRVETIVTGQSASSVPAGATATLVFGGDGRVSIDTGCNTGAGSYTVEGATLRLSALAMTKRACAGPAGELEQAVLRVLEAGTVDYAIEAAALTLTAGDRGLGLRVS